jgi:hypothetical protein
MSKVIYEIGLQSIYSVVFLRLVVDDNMDRAIEEQALTKYIMKCTPACEHCEHRGGAVWCGVSTTADNINNAFAVNVV